MKAALSFVTLLLFATFSSAQIVPQTPWTWMKGDNTIDQPGVYGIQGVAGQDNKPGGRNISTTWKDQSGNLWLFGGMGFGTGGSGFLNDLWKFNPVTNKWAWVKGDDTPDHYGVYGINGLADPSNKPGGVYSGISWVDNDGNFWLFGGYGYSESGIGLLNSLWKYDPSTNNWAWIKGDKTIDQAGVYGNKGIAHSANKPGARYCSQSWTDDNGDLYLFGGYGYDKNIHGELNDIWKYNIPTNEWTWIKGDSTTHQAGTYGTEGVSSPGNNPGSRYLSISWKDQSNDLWLFGGYGLDEQGLGSLNDLWKYSSSTNEWTWISGNKTIDQQAVYGIPGIPAPTNKPGARYISSAWMDPGGDLWMFGGYGYDASNAGYLNDLWKYSPGTNKWTWVKGDNTVDQFAIYGVLGLPDILNKSGARNGGVSWADGNGNLWLFGGYGFDGTTTGVLNDLWKINSFGSILPLKLLQFDGTLNNDIVRLQWQTAQETGFSHFIIQRSFDGMNFTSLGDIAGTGYNGTHQYTYPDFDLKNHSEAVVFYRLQLVNNDGSSSFSKVLRFGLSKKDLSVHIFPNPVVHSLNLSFDQVNSGPVTIFIMDMKGVVVKKQSGNMGAGRASISMDVSGLPASTYVLSVTGGALSQQLKFIKE